MTFFALGLVGDPARDLAAAAERIGTAATATMAEAGADLRDALRDQVVAAGLVGSRLAASWRVGRVHSDNAGVSVTVSSSAPRILSTFAEGATILPRRGRWLAIPTAAVPRGKRRRFLSPTEVEAQLGRPLRFIPAPGGRTAVLTDGRAVLFVLAPQVTLAKRFDLDAAVAGVERALPARFDRRLSET